MLLYFHRQSSIATRASVRVQSCSRLRHSSRKRALKLSTYLPQRREESLPVLESIEALLQKEAERYPAKSALAEAIYYARNQWGKLSAYVDHGQARIDNKLTEQAIRPCKLGAENWLFVGSPEAGKTSAVIYTILESYRRRGIEPMAYLGDVLRRLPSMTNLEAESLAPKDWKNTQVKTC